MRLDELFRNLGYVAATIGAQVRDSAWQGVPLEELDLTGPAPDNVALLGPAQVVPFAPVLHEYVGPRPCRRVHAAQLRSALGPVLAER